MTIITEEEENVLGHLQIGPEIGWLCPVCKHVFAPFVSSCQFCPQELVVSTTGTGVNPLFGKPQTTGLDLSFTEEEVDEKIKNDKLDLHFRKASQEEVEDMVKTIDEIDRLCEIKPNDFWKVLGATPEDQERQQKKKLLKKLLAENKIPERDWKNLSEKEIDDILVGFTE